MLCFLLSTLTIFGNRNLIITITPTFFEIYIELNDTLQNVLEDKRCSVFLVSILAFDGGSPVFSD